jgi:hypothetical protein
MSKIRGGSLSPPPCILDPWQATWNSCCIIKEGNKTKEPTYHLSDNSRSKHRLAMQPFHSIPFHTWSVGFKHEFCTVQKHRLTKQRSIPYLIILYPCRSISSSGKESMMALSGPGSLNLTEKAMGEKVVPCSAPSKSTKGCKSQI